MAAIAGKTGAIFYRKAWIQGAGIALVNSDPDTITDTGSGLVTAGFKADDIITISGSVADDGEYTIDTGGVATGTLTLVGGDSLTGESAGELITVQEALPGTQVLGFHAWTVDETLDDLEITRFEDEGIEKSIAGIRRWSATAERFFETTQLAPESWLGTEQTVRFFYRYNAAPNVTIVWFREGKTRISSISAGTDAQGIAIETLTFTGIAQAAISGTGIAFVDSDPDTITDTSDGFILAGFEAGQKITVSGAGESANNIDFTIATVAKGTITLISTDEVTAEVATEHITIRAEVRLTEKSDAWPT